MIGRPPIFAVRIFWTEMPHKGDKAIGFAEIIEQVVVDGWFALVVIIQFVFHGQVCDKELGIESRHIGREGVYNGSA